MKSLRTRYPVVITHFLPLLPLLVLGLAGGRLLYEALFPRWAWLGRPLPALLLAATLLIVPLLF